MLRALLASLLLALPAGAETIYWATVGPFPKVVGWELCDPGGARELIVPTRAWGQVWDDGRPANVYEAEVQLFGGVPSWIQAHTVDGVVLPQNQGSRLWCTQWDYDKNGTVGAGDLAQWLQTRNGAPFSEFTTGLKYFFSRKCGG